MIAAYRESEFLVLPSRWELSPLTPLEGFVFKKPTISTDIHGIPYTLKKNENCLLIENEDSVHLSQLIVELANNDEMRKRLGESGFNHVDSELNSKTMVKKTLKIYETIADNYQLGKEK